MDVVQQQVDAPDSTGAAKTDVGKWVLAMENFLLTRLGRSGATVRSLGGKKSKKSCCEMKLLRNRYRAGERALVRTGVSPGNEQEIVHCLVLAERSPVPTLRCERTCAVD